MNRQQAVEFIQALNMLQPHVAPLMFGHLAGTEIVRHIVGIANGQLVCRLEQTGQATDASENRS